MYKIKHVIFLFAVLAASLLSHAQSSALPDFTNLDDPAVTCYWGNFLNPKMIQERDEYFHQVITEQGHDYWIDELPLLPPGEDRVVKLGDFDATGYNYNYDAEAISYQFTVDPSRSILLLKFAVILQDPGDDDHAFDERPRFKVRVTDLNDVLVDDCAVYDVTAYGHVPGFIPADNKIIWRPWTSVGIDLTPYSGREIRVEFTTYDCALGEHFGYAYYTAQCISNKFQVENCTNPITLKAPDFFESYLWNTGSTEQSETFLVPENTPVDVSCLVTSVTGCQFTLYGRLAYDDGMPTEDTEIYDTACIRSWYNDNYFNFMTGDTPGDMPPVINTIVNLGSGCSTVNITLHLHLIDRVPDNHIFRDICDGDDFHDLNFDITSDMLSPGENVFSHDDLSPSGCDSTTVLHLFVNNSYNLLFSEQACSGDSYSGHGFLIENTKPGTLDSTLNLSTSAGCDSIVTLHLLVNPSHNIALYDTIGFGIPYNKYDFYQENPPIGWNTYSRELKTKIGCDSIVTLHLLVGEVFENIFTDTICFGQDYDNDDFHFTKPSVGTHIDSVVYETVLGCDSVIKIRLCVNPVYDIGLFDTICEGESYHEHGFNIENPVLGSNYDTMRYESSLGCDSIVHIEVFVRPVFDITIDDTICYGSDYHDFNFDTIRPETGLCIMQQNIKSQYNCDSIITLNLHVLDSYSIEITDTICHGENYQAYNFNIENHPVGIDTFTQNLTTIFGCDSIVKLNLIVAPVDTTTFYDTICEGESYHENGFHFVGPIPGSHTLQQDSVISSFGCDSLLILHLKVHPKYDILITDTACSGETYDKYGFQIADLEPGITFDSLSLESMYGCDSTVRLELHVSTSYFETITDTICFGQDYYENNFEFGNLEPGWHYDTIVYISTMNCDSVVDLSLYVAPVFDTMFSDTICFGESYSGHGFTIENPGNGWNFDTLNLETVLGCDSVVRLELYVAQVFDTVLSDTICFGNSYSGHGFIIENPGKGWNFDTLRLETVLGCDSVVRLELYVAEVFDTVFSDTICFGETYHLHGFDKDSLEVGWTFDTLRLHTVLNCDSIVSLQLLVVPVYDYDIYDTACLGEQYHEYGFNIDSLVFGWNHDTLRLETVFGCDSTVRLNLYVDSLRLKEIYDTICFGEDYHNHNFHFLDPQAGNHTLRNEDLGAYGCDSITLLHLAVGEIFDINIFDTICYGEPYNNNGFLLDSLEAGLWHDTLHLKTILDCDSTILLNLHVAPVFDTAFYDTICFGESYHEHGFVKDSLATGWNLDTLRLETAFGCDSVIRLELLVMPTQETNLFDTICSGESYYYNNFTFDSPDAGWNLDTLRFETTFGCDSIVIMHLLVGATYDTIFNDTVCVNEGYHSHGFSIDTLLPGWNFSSQALSSVLGCDSLVHVNIFAAPVFDTTIQDTICFGNTYSNHGFVIDSPASGLNIEMLELESITGCDSTIHLELFVADVFDTIIFDTTCFGEPYSGHGFYLDSLDIGWNFDTLNLETILGCDSTVVLNLLVGAMSDTTLTDTICYGEPYYENGFHIDSLQTGLNFDTLNIETILGCDSTVMLELYVAPVFETVVFDTACYGEAYSGNGFHIENPETGWNYDTIRFETILGCDSIKRLELFIADVFDTVIFDTTCFGQPYNNHGFQLDSIVPGFNFDTLKFETVLGCDSIIKLELFVNESFDITLSDTICIGESYHGNGFNFVDPNVGTHEQTLTLSSNDGCDSTVTFRLNVAPDYFFEVTDTVCEGEYVTLYGLDTSDLVPGVHRLTSNLLTQYGCDSIFDITLKVEYSFKTPNEIYGLTNIFVSTNMLTGGYNYYIDTIPGCDEYLWTIDNETWIIRPNGNSCKLLAITYGTGTLTVSSGNICGDVEKSIDLTAEFFGVTENEGANVNVYPNPTNGDVRVEANVIEKVNVYSPSGVMLLSFDGIGENSIYVDISGLSPSVYIFEIFSADGIFLKKVTKTSH